MKNFLNDLVASVEKVVLAVNEENTIDGTEVDLTNMLGREKTETIPKKHKRYDFLFKMKIIEQVDYFTNRCGFQ